MGYLAGQLSHLYQTDNLNGPSGPKEKTSSWSGAEISGQELTRSTPFATADWIYFQGTDRKLRRVRPDGSGTETIGGYTSQGSPVVADGYVYFRGENNGLYRVRVTGDGFEQIGGHWTINVPFVFGNRVHFQGARDELLVPVTGDPTS